MVHTVKLMGNDWLANECAKGARGAQDQLLAEPRGKDTVYIRYNHKDGYRYVDFEALEAAELVGDGNHHMYELILGQRKRKFYMDYDIDVPGDGRPPEEH